MKYDRIIAWVRPHEKKNFQKVNCPIIFIQKFNELNNLLIKDYVVISSMYANTYNKKILKLIQSFPNNTFILYDNRKSNEDLPENVGILWTCENCITGLYTENDIIQNYLGIIPDLLSYVQKNFHIEFNYPGATLVPNLPI